MRSDLCLAVLTCLITLHAAAPPQAEAVPTMFGSNAYEFVAVPNPFTGDNNRWETARDVAAASIFGGVSGHLATITSQPENDFLAGLALGKFTGFAGAWLGGDAPEGWLVGPEAGQAFTFTNFGGIEPNNAGKIYMQIGTSGPAAFGKWLDDSGVNGLPDPNADPVVGYFVEWERPLVVPEPGTLALVALGLLAILAPGRRR